MNNRSKRDKSLEYARYDGRARELISDKGVYCRPDVFGSMEVPLHLRAPYAFFESQVRRYVGARSSVLELGSGTGMHTGILLQVGGRVVASDISKHCLEVLRNRYESEKLSTEIADMESLPFSDRCFDAVTSAGSLSYGDNRMVMMEIYRVLKPGGVFICVDSLAHNPVYRLNRWLHYLRGKRTISTLKRMPRIEIIEQYRQTFGSIETNFFGAISWLGPLMNRVFGDEYAASFSQKIDNILNVKRSAFKFVMVARKEI